MTFASTSPSKLSGSYLSSKKLPPPPPPPQPPQPPDPPLHTHHHKETVNLVYAHSSIGSVPMSDSTNNSRNGDRRSPVEAGFASYNTDFSSSSDSGTDYSTKNGTPSIHYDKIRTSSLQTTPSSRSQPNSTAMRPSGSTNSMLSQEDVEYYYTKLINYEFRNLQLDTELQKMSLFDLIDYCESLYELANESTDHLQAIKSYTKGFLIFNYFINSFVMFHFDGFDAFIESNEQDFIIYLNIFAFYNTEQAFQNGNYTVSSSELRLFIKSYLVKKNLLSFDLDELYEWLFQYIDYLRDKDQSADEIGFRKGTEEDAQKVTLDGSDGNSDVGGQEEYTDSASDADEVSNGAYDDELSFVRVDHPPTPGMGRQSRESSLGSISGFKVRYPSVNLPKRNGGHDPHSGAKSVNEKALKKPPPPIPTSLPPALLSQQLDSISVHTRNDHLEINGVSGGKDKGMEPGRIHRKEGHQDPYPNDDIISKLTEEETTFGQDAQASTSQDIVQGYTRKSQRPPIPAAHAVGVNNFDSSAVNQKYNHSHRVMPNGRQYSYASTGQPIYQTSTPMPTFPPPQPHIQPPHPSILYLPYGYSNGAMTQYQQLPGSSYDPAHQQYQQPNYPQYFSHPSPQSHPMIPAHVLKQQEQIKSGKMSIRKDYAICGLRNFGSSCYINSTIQMLFGIYSFKVIFNRGYQKYVKDPGFLKIMQHPDSHKKDSVLLSEAVSGLLRTFQQNGGLSVSPTKFIRVTSLLKPDFNIPHEQQDSQEFLLFVLERLHAELCDKSLEYFDPEVLCAKWNINVSVENRSSYFKWWRSLHEHEGSSPISDLFQGHLQNKLRCNKCSYESITYSPFSILSLPIPNTKRPNEVVDLTSCLSYYIQDETLSGENAWRCPKCHGEVPTVDNHPVFVQKKGLFKLGKSKKTPAASKGNKVSSSDTISTKSLSFVKLPPILFIHLSRFSMHNLTDKLSTPIRYPIELRFNNQGHEILYKISGVINHFGNLKSGHYTALINKSTTNESKHDLENLKNPCWCNFDDENVRSSVNNGTLRLGVDGQSHSVLEMISTDVYVLCYERVDA
ncbi:hypothetical protein KGF57_002935 [Candida theae]|uniref:ubiquitinyl hydrolase 1 n=1 Tax=Candida theae TaxID=1198502 RepID=A0AAD5FY65_9ASCO|nr:uncharacterized protein KGF57_002935 [Candida theae]KAI5957669.1 hypothetical protein KGF57_002935 [Candida theae]